jgi:hypothetical protein
VGALATREKGEETEDPFSGLLTVMPAELVAAPWEDPVTAMLTATEHTTPPVPQALTCTVWLPVLALTVAPIVELPTMVVLELLSSE